MGECMARRLVTARHLIGIVTVAVCLAGLLAFRHAYVDPSAWGAQCAPSATNLPWACTPRAALLWLQHFQLWGGIALALGLFAFIGAPFAVAVAGVALGAMAVVNYNATWGMLGLALAAWAWIGSGTGAAGPEPDPLARLP
jgi:hypothetical protein